MDNCSDSCEDSGCKTESNDPFDVSSLKDSIIQEENKSGIDNEEQTNNNDTESCSDSEEELDMNDEELSKIHKDLSEKELEKLKEQANALKIDGNKAFKTEKHSEAIALYTNALNICPLKFQNERSVLYANRAAARLGLDKKDEALLDCNKAIELNPDYLRAILRRAQLHRKLDNLDRCLEDYKKVMELDKNNLEARQACATLPPEIAERNEKLKTEMFGKLKDLGNICLKPFGLSTDNFKMVQDPKTGGYSVNFQK